MNLVPDKVFEKEWMDTYKKRISVLHLEMSEIRMMFFLYEQIVKFPFHLFGIYKGPFWTLTRKSMFVAIVVGLWRLLYDDDPNSLTVSKMRNEVMQGVRDDEAKQEIAKILRRANVKERLVSIKNEIQRMRHEDFAHLDVTNVDNPSNQESPSVTLSEISNLLDTAEEVINAIGLDTEYIFLPMEYHPDVRHPKGVNTRPDIEKMLDDMVQSCPDFHLPETDPDKFKFYWKHRNPKERKIFNEYRKKFSLPEIENIL